MHLMSRMKHILFVALLLGFVVAYASQEWPQERFFPSDSALYAANGAFFLTAFQEAGNVVKDPRGWAYAYYEQYPAVSVRRHPPVFGLAESLVYSFTGVSIFGANLTICLFAIVFVLGMY